MLAVRSFDAKGKSWDQVQDVLPQHFELSPKNPQPVDLSTLEAERNQNGQLQRATIRLLAAVWTPSVLTSSRPVKSPHRSHSFAQAYGGHGCETWRSLCQHFQRWQPKSLHTWLSTTAGPNKWCKLEAFGGLICGPSCRVFGVNGAAKGGRDFLHVQKMMKRSLDCFRLLASIHHNFRICYRTRECALVQGSSRKPRHRSKDCCCSCSSELFPASTAQHTTPLFHSCSFRFMSPAPLRFRISWYLSMYLITTMTHQMQCSTPGTPLNSSPQGSQALNP